MNTMTSGESATWWEWIQNPASLEENKDRNAVIWSMAVQNRG